MCEFITGGGFNHVALDGPLIHEGQMMRDALLRDLSVLSYEIYSTVDARITPPKDCYKVSVIDQDDDVWQIWEQIIATVDAVWLIAPETDSMLEKMTKIAAKKNKFILGCDVASIKITASKMKTYEIFRDTDVSVLPTFTVNDWECLKGGACVVKPDDGAACEDTLFLKDVESIKDWLTQNKVSQRHIIQPYQSGVPASLSCIFHAGKVQLLSCNEQLIMLRHNAFSFKGVIVNGMVDYWVELEQLATKVAQHLPSLRGYVGIDVIIDQNSGKKNEIVLLEINPRMTCSFVVMAEAIGTNPAALLINTLMGGGVNGPVLQRNRVCFDVQPS